MASRISGSLDVHFARWKPPSFSVFFNATTLFGRVLLTEQMEVVVNIPVAVDYSLLPVYLALHVALFSVAMSKMAAIMQRMNGTPLCTPPLVRPSFAAHHNALPTSSGKFTSNNISGATADIAT